MRFPPPVPQHVNNYGHPETNEAVIYQNWTLWALYMSACVCIGDPTTSFSPEYGVSNNKGQPSSQDRISHCTFPEVGVPGWGV
mmetsp:Transcript_84019/g.140219  ORF Transcript_84019/g.140219 Transcript_84019/m.140219 type:complete len:83 (+) Transcript_84019:141-389(+)